ncbi:MAG: hypothetical protein WBC05_16760 [Sedimentisphaerales bacterium]
MNRKYNKDKDQTKSNLLTRGDFLAQAGGAMLATAAATASCLGGQSTITRRHRWKGRSGSNVKRWDVITIGNLSRNRYWGESDAKGVRAAICTCTLITGKDFRVLVDPSLTDEAEMARELYRDTTTTFWLTVLSEKQVVVWRDDNIANSPNRLIRYFS